EMRLKAIVLNRVVTNGGTCVRCRRRVQMKRQAERFLRSHYPRVPRLIGPDPGNPLLGATLLRRFGDNVFTGSKASLSSATPRLPKRQAQWVKTKWPMADTRLSFTLGKGGVGKTTTTAALAFQTRAHSKAPVTVCSTDPAPSLDDIFEKEIPNHLTHVL